MKTFFDSEGNILDLLNGFNKSDCLILSDKIGSSNYWHTAEIIDSLLDVGYMSRWGDNTVYHRIPDFYNKSGMIGLEVMRFDDHSKNGKKNPTLALERKIADKVEPFLSQFPEMEVLIDAATDLPTNEDHNYKNLYTGFRRTVLKHLGRLPTYKQNCPNSQIAFLVFNEATGIYFETAFPVERDVQLFDQMIGRPHFIFCDRRFVSTFIDSDLDYLILFSPFYGRVSNYSGVGRNFPPIVIYDVKMVRKNSKFRLIDYDETRMISTKI